MEQARRIGLYDAHCHPTDIMSATSTIPKMRAKALTVMSTRAQDQALVYGLTQKYPIPPNDDLDSDKQRRTFVVPAFGWHPWFSYRMYDDLQGEIDAEQHYRRVLTPEPDDDFVRSLPPPIPVSKFLAETEERLRECPTALVGEIGLDRPFRIPHGVSHDDDKVKVLFDDTTTKSSRPEEGEHTPGSREGRPLSPYRVQLEHQKMVLKAQLELAAKHDRPVSVHSVATHGVVFGLLQSLWKGHEKPSKAQRKKQKKDATHMHEHDSVPEQHTTLPYPRRICMHSYSGPADALKQFLGNRVPADIYFSFSELINFGSHNSGKAVDVIKALPDDKILIESDLHCAGEQMDSLHEDILKRICKIKGWRLEEGALQLKRNWYRFIFGKEITV